MRVFFLLFNDVIICEEPWWIL